MEKLLMNIQKAIDHFNARRKDGQPKMTQASLARAVYGKDSGKTGEVQIGRLVNNNFSGIKPSEVIAISRATGVDPNFLFNYKK